MPILESRKIWGARWYIGQYEVYQSGSPNAVVFGEVGQMTWTTQTIGEMMEQPVHNTTVCILGMHRSGTSCLAGSLEERGLHLGEVINFARYNLRGNKENQECMTINNDVLKLSGGSWDNPPKTVVWDDDLRKRRDEHLAGYTSFTTWGFKDPRALLTLPFWQEAIPSIRFVGSFRHPQAVERSLMSRGPALVPAIPPVDLWKHYNLKLLEYVSQFRFPLICFDWPATKYVRAIDLIARDLGLEVSPDAPLQFYEDSLRNSDIDDGRPGCVETEEMLIYEQLMKHAVNVRE